MLIFDVELLGITPAGTSPTPKPATYDSSRPASEPGAPIPPKPAASVTPCGLTEETVNSRLVRARRSRLIGIPRAWRFGRENLPINRDRER